MEPEFQKLYSYLFDLESWGQSAEEMDRPLPTVIFLVNFDKVCVANLTVKFLISLNCLILF